MNFIHLQDAHIKPQTWASLPSVKEDAYLALNQIPLEILQSYGEVPAKFSLIISGDLFDSTRIHASDLAAVTKLCKDFAKVYYIIGTHDHTEPPFLQSLDNTYWLKDGEIETAEDGVRLSGIQYNRSREYLLECLKKLRKQGFGASKDLRDVLVLHQGFQHLLGFEGAYQLTLNDLLEYVPEARVLCGHVHVFDHTPFKALPTGLGHDGWFLSTGPLYPQEMPQTRAFCGITAFSVGKNQNDMVNQIPINVRKYPVLRGVDHYLKENLETLEKEAEQDIEMLPPLVTIMVDSGVTLQSLGVQDGQYPHLIIRTSVTGVEGAAREAVEQSLVEYTLEDAVKDELKDPDKQALMLELLHSDSPERKLQQLLNDNNIETR